tara:strand:- start:4394 stop:4621 length:228 start_codon:yes stop_codon:yes gene_type:complete
MYSSEQFGRLFWVDDDFDFKSCPQNKDGTGDFTQKDYVSEWTDWEGVNMDLLFKIHKTCIFNQQDYAGGLTLKGA